MIHDGLFFLHHHHRMAGVKPILWNEIVLKVTNLICDVKKTHIKIKTLKILVEIN